MLAFKFHKLKLKIVWFLHSVSCVCGLKMLSRAPTQVRLFQVFVGLSDGKLNYFNFPLNIASHLIGSFVIRLRDTFSLNNEILLEHRLWIKVNTTQRKNRNFCAPPLNNFWVRAKMLRHHWRRAAAATTTNQKACAITNTFLLLLNIKIDTNKSRNQIEKKIFPSSGFFGRLYWVSWCAYTQNWLLGNCKKSLG